MRKPNASETSKKLRACRKNCGLSQYQVSAALGMDRSTYSYYENGREPGLDTLVKLAKIFRVDVQTLLPSENPSDLVADNTPESPTPIYSLTKDEQSLLVSFRLLDDDRKADVLANITNMLKDEN